MQNSFDPKEIRWDLAIFYRWDKHGKFVLRPRYQTFACPTCGKIDPKAALEAGIDADIELKEPNLDAIPTTDEQTILSMRCYEALTSLAGVKLESWRIPKQSNHVLVLPGNLVLPPSNLAAGKKMSPREVVESKIPYRRHGEKCKRCGRYEGLTISSGFIEVAESIQLAGLWLERSTLAVPYIAWMISNRVAESLEKNRFRGIRIEKSYYATGLTLAQT